MDGGITKIGESHQNHGEYAEIEDHDREKKQRKPPPPKKESSKEVDIHTGCLRPYEWERSIDA